MISEIQIKPGQLVYCAKPTTFVEPNCLCEVYDALSSVGFYLCLRQKYLAVEEDTEDTIFNCINQEDEQFVQKEFETTGKVSGFLFLAPSGRNVWINSYDLGYILSNDPQPKNTNE